MSDKVWQRVRDGIYKHLPSGTTIERYNPPNNSNFSIWSVTGQKGANFSTLRDAKAYVLRGGPTPSREQPPND